MEIKSAVNTEQKSGRRATLRKGSSPRSGAGSPGRQMKREEATSTFGFLYINKV